MRLVARVLAAGLMLTTGSFPAAAADGDEPIVVTGNREMSRKEATDVVRRIAQPVAGQMARFNGRICPIVLGFQDRYEAIAAARIRSTAQAAGAPVGKQDCAPNLYVVVVDSGPDFVRALRQSYPEAFEGITKRQFAVLSKGPGAARAWASTVQTTRNGVRVGGTNPEAEPVQPAMSSNPNVPNGKYVWVDEASNVRPSVRQNIAASWLVIETGATIGKTLDQIADYAAFRSLAMVEPDPSITGLDTILSLFEPDGSPPSGLTEFDRSYLNGLYGTPAQASARTQMERIGKSIAEDQAEAR